MGVVSQGQLKIMSFIKSVASTGPGRVLRFAAARRSSARFLSSSSTRASGKVYEFRTYAVHPARMKECMGVMEDLMPVRTVFSKLNGCWYTELGGLNEVNFLWEYDNLSHRASVRKQLAASEDWVGRCLPRLLPLLASQTNMLLKPFSWYEPKLDPVKGYSMYELVRHDVKAGLLSQFEHIAQEGMPSRLAFDYPKPVGMWYSEFGPGQIAFSISPHVNLEERAKHRDEIMSDPVWRETWKASMKLINKFTVKALVPAAFSPLQ